MYIQPRYFFYQAITLQVSFFSKYYMYKHLTYEFPQLLNGCYIYHTLRAKSQEVIIKIDSWNWLSYLRRISATPYTLTLSSKHIFQQTYRLNKTKNNSVVSTRIMTVYTFVGRASKKDSWNPPVYKVISVESLYFKSFSALLSLAP